MKNTTFAFIFTPFLLLLACMLYLQNDRINFLQKKVIDNNASHQANRMNIIGLLQAMNNLKVKFENNFDEQNTAYENQLLAVHECAQVIPFAERAHQACDPDLENYYCKVSELFTKHCLSIDGNGHLVLPQNPDLNKKILKLLSQYE